VRPTWNIPRPHMRLAAMVGGLLPHEQGSA
jgi:hypothetical protein